MTINKRYKSYNSGTDLAIALICIVFLIAIAVAISSAWMLLIIWAVNVIFDVAIPYTIKSVAAMWVLHLVVGGIFKLKK